MRECLTCGNRFQPIANQRYCGSPCVSPSRELASPKDFALRRCDRCGGEFQPIHSNHRYCSDRCQRGARVRRERTPRICSRCGEQWTASRKTQTTLCVGCREADRLEHVYTNRKGWRSAVCNRANNLCESCGRTEEQVGSYHHAHHIIPRAAGGQNTLANGKLLCVDCHDQTHGGLAVGGTPLSISARDIERIARRVAELVR